MGARIKYNLLILLVLSSFAVLGFDASLYNAEFYYSNDDSDLVGSNITDISTLTTQYDGALIGVSTGETGKINQGFNFSGVYSRVTNDFHHALNSHYTAMGWFYSDEEGDRLKIYEARTPTTSQVLELFANWNGNEHYLICGMRDAVGSQFRTVIDDTALYTPNQWNFFTCRYNGTYLSMWLNGVETDKVAVTTSGSTTSQFTIGAQEDTEREFIGRIDEFSFYEEALPNEAILQAYNSSLGMNPFSSGDAPIPPNITFGNVSINGVEYPETGGLNNSIIPFLSGYYVFNTTINGSDIDEINISLYNSSGLIATGATAELNISSILLIRLGLFNLSVFANNTDGSESTSMISFNVTDITNPVCTGLDNKEGYSIGDYTFNWSVTCEDENFFSFNISCDSGFNYYKDGLNQEIYTFTNSTTINSSTQCAYTYCDGHTTAELYEKWFVRPDKDKIEFQVNDKIHTLKSLDGGNITYSKEKDRILFSVALDKISPLGADFQYTTSDQAYYFPSSKYPGWIIDSKSRTWFDMAQEYPGYTVKVVQWNYTTWNIKVIPPIEIEEKEPVELEFKSIGELNCISGTHNLTIIIPQKKPSYSVIRPPVTTAAALTLLILFVLWFGLILFTYKLEGAHGQTIQIFNLAQLIVGILLLIYVYKTFNGLLALVFGLVSLGVFVAKAISGE